MPPKPDVSPKPLAPNMSRDRPCTTSLEAGTHEIEDVVGQYFGVSISNYKFQDLRRDIGVIGRMKMLSAQFLRGVPNGAHLRTAVLRSQTMEEMEPLFDEYFALAERYGIAVVGYEAGLKSSTTSR